jgi:amino acid transporter
LSENVISNKNWGRLSTIPLAAIGISSIFGLRNLPVVAEYGLSSVTLYVLAALLFFIPSAYVCSYLSKTFECSGGVYGWVQQIFGEHLGFVAMWLEWINTVVSFPMMLSFVIYTFLYAIAPQLAHGSSVLQFIIFIGLFWGVSFISTFGLEVSSKFITLFVMLGTLLSAAIISILGIIWLIEGNTPEISFSANQLIPDLHIGTLAFLISVVNGFSGIQSIGFHRNESKTPESTIPKAIKLTVIIILLFSIVTTLAIAVVIPHDMLILIGGIIQAIHFLFTNYGLDWLEPIVVSLIGLGVLAEVTSWIIGPSKGIAEASHSGYIFKKWGKYNTKGVPVNVLLVQCVISTILASIILITPSISFAYWLLSALTGQFALLMWVLVFSSILYYTFSNNLNLFWLKLSSIVGLIVCLVIATFGYIPPSNIVKTTNEIVLYEIFLLGGLVIFVITPLLVHYFRTKIKK